MVNFWLNAGYILAMMLIPVLIGGLLFRKFVAPGINEALGDILEAKASITNMAKLAGVKSQEYKDSKGLEKVVAQDLITTNLPELEALKLILSPSAWEKIEETIEDNPEAVLQLYEKYGHLLKAGVAQETFKADYG